MEARELRIGNLVMVGEKRTKIESITDEGINQDVDFGEYGGMNYDGQFGSMLWNRNKEIKPIPLTEEWLLKFGISSHYTTVVGFVKFGIVYNNGCYVEIGDQIIEMKYFHELQNLYFALTGEELNISSIAASDSSM